MTTNDSEEINVTLAVDSLSEDNDDPDGVEDIKRENDEVSSAVVICTDDKTEPKIPGLLVVRSMELPVKLFVLLGLKLNESNEDIRNEGIGDKEP